jgi:hypothetical protein
MNRITKLTGSTAIKLKVLENMLTILGYLILAYVYPNFHISYITWRRTQDAKTRKSKNFFNT